MQKCVKCQNKFKYQELLRQQWDFNNHNSLICSKCNTEHRPSRVTGIISSVLIMTPTLIFINIHRIFGINRLLFIFSWIVLMILLLPIYARYGQKSDKKND